jgi:hypothetical protein
MLYRISEVNCHIMKIYNNLLRQYTSTNTSTPSTTSNVVRVQYLLLDSVDTVVQRNMSENSNENEGHKIINNRHCSQFLLNFTSLLCHLCDLSTSNTGRIKIIIIGSITNDICQSIKQPYRLGSHIIFPLPNKVERQNAFDRLLSSFNVVYDSGDIDISTCLGDKLLLQSQLCNSMAQRSQVS